MAFEKITKFFSSLNLVAKTSTIVGILAGFTGIMSWLGITPEIITKKEMAGTKNDTITNITTIPPTVQISEDGHSKPAAFSRPATTPVPKDQTKVETTETIKPPVFLSSSYKNITSPFKLSFIVRRKDKLDQKFAIQTGSSLSAQGIKCNPTLFNDRVLPYFNDLESPYNDAISDHLHNLTDWYLIGDLTESEKENSINKSDVTAIVSFSGYLIGVSEANTGKQIPLNITERQAGESGIAVDKARDNLSQKIASMLKEQL